MSPGTGHRVEIKMINKNIKITYKKLTYSLLVAVLVLSLIPFLTQPVNAVEDSEPVEECKTDSYSLNNIMFYEPEPCRINLCSAAVAGGALTSPAPTSLVGETNQAKAWNYFIARGLTPVAAAGAMGNIQHESSFSASVEEAGGGGLGIIQWTGDRRTNLENAAAAAGVNLADNDSALLFELNYLWDGEYGAMVWQEQVNAEITVEGNTAIASFNSNFSGQLAETQAGNGSTMVFHALIERSNDVPTEADRYSGVGVLQGRIDTAKEFLGQFGTGGTTSTDPGSCGVTIKHGGSGREQDIALIKNNSEWNVHFFENGVHG